MNNLETPQSIESDQSESLSAGKRLEKQVFADVDCAWNGKQWIEIRKQDKQEAFKRLDEWAKKQPISGWFETRDISQKKQLLLSWVKKHQPWNPTEPGKISFTERRGLGNLGKDVVVESTVPIDLHYLVAEDLGLEDYRKLAFYTSADTPLDTVYGIDGFMEWNGTMLTLDITKNDEKLENQRLTEDKADFIFTFHDVDEEGSFQKIPPHEIELVASNIARALKNNARRRI